jgi:hypothetical protein
MKPLARKGGGFFYCQMTLKLSPKAANQLIGLWLDESKMSKSPPELEAELKAAGFPVYWALKSRVFVGAHSRAANDALWDGDLLAAWGAFVTEGLSFKAKRRVALPVGNARRGAVVNTIGSARLSGQESSPQHDWHYVK